MVGVLRESVASKIVKVRCPRCPEPLVVKVKPELSLLKCACGCYFLLLAD